MTDQTPTLGTGLPIQLPKLMETRALIQAGSGGGKSWVMRRLIEQTAPHVQQFVIDIEGEFASLREQFEFVLCAPIGGDVVANPQTAAALARALSESGCSAVLDISELSASDRLAFVDRFIMALINLPKSKWQPAMILVDEASFFAPQTGGGAALDAMIALAQRGRKRGLCLIAATQRISNLNKNVAAELLNKLTGRTGLDVDIKRAADDLGMNLREATEKLRALPPGEFFMYGPALSEQITHVKIGKVVTSHPKVGHRSITPPKASPGLLEKLAKFQGVQQAVEEEEVTVENLQARIKELESGNTSPTPEAYEAVCRARDAWQQRAERFYRILTGYLVGMGVEFTKLAVQYPPDLRDLDGKPDPSAGIRISLSDEEAKDLAEKLGKMADSTETRIVAMEEKDGWSEILRQTGGPGDHPSDAYLAHLGHGPGQKAKDDRMALSEPRKRILDALMALEGMGVPAPTRATLGAFAGASPRSSAYINNLGGLRSASLVDYPGGGLVAITAEGRKVAKIARKHYTLDDLHAAWLGILTTPQQRILMVLVREQKNHPLPISVSRDWLAKSAEASPISSAYINNLGAMRSLGCITYPSKGQVGISEILFPKGLK